MGEHTLIDFLFPPTARHLQKVFDVDLRISPPYFAYTRDAPELGPSRDDTGTRHFPPFRMLCSRSSSVSPLKNPCTLIHVVRLNSRLLFDSIYVDDFFPPGSTHLRCFPPMVYSSLLNVLHYHQDVIPSLFRFDLWNVPLLVFHLDWRYQFSFYDENLGFPPPLLGTLVLPFASVFRELGQFLDRALILPPPFFTIGTFFRTLTKARACGVYPPSVPSITPVPLTHPLPFPV